MGRFRAAALALAALIPFAHAQEEPTFRADVRLVRMLVTVKDRNGKPVGGLGKGDFTVTDNGVMQKLALLERESAQPLSIAMLVDTSGSTGKDMRYETDSVKRFFKAVVAGGNPQDSVSLYSFNYEVNQRSPYTRDIGHLNRKLGDLHGEAGTSLYDALWFASRDLHEREGRHVIVVVTDGGDTTSSKTYHAALEAVQGADAVLYAILVVPITNDAGRNTGGENALTTMTGATGGQVFTPAAVPELDAAFRDILNELRTQYLLGYYPQGVPRGKERFHRTVVTVGRPGLRVSARSGYYGEADEPAFTDRRSSPR